MTGTLDEAVADLQRANAELRRQLDEALQRETATAEVLQVINSSPGDLAPVFDAILDKAINLCEAAFGTLWTYDGEHFAAVALHRVPQAFAEFLSREPFPTEPGSAHERLTHGERVVQFEDVAAHESIGPARRALVEGGGARSLIAVPLRKDDKLLGVITAYRQEVRPFTDKQIALLQNFAAQAVIAMENARLITETREALAQQTATAEVLQVINSSPGDLAPVFDAMLEKATELCDAPVGTLWLFDGEHINPVATRGVPEGLADFLHRGPHKPNPVQQRQLRGEGTIHLADLKATALYHDGDTLARAVADLGGIQTVLSVPLRREDRVLGLFGVYRQEARPFSDKQIALIDNFAAQAVIAIDNARLITETQEALEQQTATAEILGVINSSPGDLAPVFEAMLEKATRLCEADASVFCAYDGECFLPAAWRGFDDFPREPIRPHPETGIGRLARGEDLVHIADSATGEAYQSGDPGRRAIVQLGGARSQLCAALRKDGVLLGSFTIWRRAVRPFTDKQIALLQNFAAQAVIAMENARLIAETREALDQQTATAEVLQVINSSPGDLTPVFDTMLEKALNLCEASYGGLQTFDGELFRMIAHRGDQRYQDLAMHMGPFRPEPGSTVDRLVQGESVVQVLDLSADEQYKGDGPIRRTLVEIGGARTFLSIALRKDEMLVGALHVYRQEVRPFTDKQIALLQNFAAQAVIAMENARLLGELRQRTEEVAELNRGLEARVNEQVEELGRVGRLKRFLAPQVAELIVSQGDEKILESHRREIVVVFCDLRGYTAFTETAEPEEVLDFLREYHGALGPLVSQFEGTLDQFSGDGIMVFFNDPVPIPDPAERAVNMAVAMREAAGTLITDWRERGRDLGFGAGIAQGYATLGQIGFSERSGYTAIGTVCNVAARLCAEAKDGQILLSQRVNVALKGSVATEQAGALALKGLTQPVVAYNVPLAATQPALRVIEGGTQSV